MPESFAVIETLRRKGLSNEACSLLLMEAGIFLMRDRMKEEVVPGAFGCAVRWTSEHAAPDDACLADLTKGNDREFIPFERLKRVRIARGFSGMTLRREYKVVLDYQDLSRKTKRFFATIMPPLGAAPGGGGMRGHGAAAMVYAKGIEELLGRALSGHAGTVTEFSL